MTRFDPLLTCALATVPWIACAAAEPAGPDAATGSADANAAEDTTPPEVSWVAVPASPSRNDSPTLAFIASEPATFRCGLDGEVAAACSSPHPLLGLPDGDHAFSVHAVDDAGNVGPTATHAFTIDTAAPVIAIVADGSGTSWTFSFTASEPITGDFDCREDIAPAQPGTWFRCTSPHTGTYPCGATSTFHVRASDVAGNQGQSSALITPTDCCAELNCTLYCPDGYAEDDAGCPICQCKTASNP